MTTTFTLDHVHCSSYVTWPNFVLVVFFIVFIQYMYIFIHVGCVGKRVGGGGGEKVLLCAGQ